MCKRRADADTSRPYFIIEDIDDPLAKIAKLNNDCANRLVLNGFNAADRYTNGNLHIVIKFRVFGQAENWHAIFKRAFQFGSSKKVFVDGKWANDRFEGVRNGNHADMFVGAVHFVNGVEEIVPSLVWVQREDHAPRLGGDVCYFFARKGIQRLPITGKWKHGPCFGDMSIQGGQCAGEVVERCSEIVADVAELEGDARGHLADSLNLDNVVCMSVRIGTPDQGDWIGLVKFGNGNVEVVDFGFGSFNLEAGLIEG